MILKSIPSSKPPELNILTEYEAYFFVFIALLIILLFVRKKVLKKSFEYQSEPRSEQIKFDYESRDVLMQPKKKVDESEIPFKNFSLDAFHILVAIVLFIIYCSILM